MSLIKFAVLLLAGVAIHGACADEPEPIVDGRMAVDGEFPYYASLRRDGQHFCGGAIISQSHILTASHCVAAFKAPFVGLTVVTGSSNLADGEIHHVKHVIHHPNFFQMEDMSLINDLAVIKLQRPMVFSKLQKAISVATSDTLDYSEAIMIGFGRRFNNGPRPSKLISAPVTVISRDVCQQLLRPHIYLTYLCTFSLTASGNCNGDSGSPIVYDNELIGIVSWTYGDCTSGIPDVSVRIMAYNEFITNAMNNEG